MRVRRTSSSWCKRISAIIWRGSHRERSKQGSVVSSTPFIGDRYKSSLPIQCFSIGVSLPSGRMTTMASKME
ncbi:unnamed protein product [Victoria cruziana]